VVVSQQAVKGATEEVAALASTKARPEGAGEPLYLDEPKTAYFGEAMVACDFALVFWQTSDTVICIANDAAAALLGLPLELLLGRPMVDVLATTDEPSLQVTAKALANGTIDSLRSKRVVVRADGQRVNVWVWTRLVEVAGRRGGVSLLVPTAEVGRLGRDMTKPFSYLVPIALAITDADFRIRSASADVREMLGTTPDQLIGASLLELAHPGDREGVRCAARSHPSAMTLSQQVRFAHKEGRWYTACVILAWHEAEREFHLALIGGHAPTRSALARLDELELRLRRIGAEVRAANVLQDMPGWPVASDHPVLRDLSSRQWEILQKLLQGQRVPTIAKELYLSQSTVRYHLSTIFRRFGVHSQPELVALLLDRNRDAGANPAL
jgi:PAS domain S-box-containing protein